MTPFSSLCALPYIPGGMSALLHGLHTCSLYCRWCEEQAQRSGCQQACQLLLSGHHRGARAHGPDLSAIFNTFHVEHASNGRHERRVSRRLVTLESGNVSLKNVGSHDNRVKKVLAEQRCVMITALKETEQQKLRLTERSGRLFPHRLVEAAGIPALMWILFVLRISMFSHTSQTLSSPSLLAIFLFSALETVTSAAAV